MVEGQRRFFVQLAKFETNNQFYEAKGRLEDLDLFEDWRIHKRGTEQWRFALKLWSKDSDENLKQFDEAWELSRPEKSKRLGTGKTTAQKSLCSTHVNSNHSNYNQKIRQNEKQQDANFSAQYSWQTIDDINPYIENFYRLCNSEEYIKAFDTVFYSDIHDNCVYHFLSYQGYLNIIIDLYERLIKYWVPRKGEKWKFMTALASLGDAHDRMGNHEKAIEYYQNSLEIALEIDDIDNIGGSCVNLGLVYYSLEKYEEAVDCSRRGLEIAREIGNRKFEAHALNNLGLIYSDLEEYQLAIDYYHFSLEVKSKVDDPQGEAGSLINIGNTYRQLQKYEQAISYLRRGIEAAHQSHHNQFEANGWFNLALALESLHQYSDALSSYEKAFTLYQQMEMIENVEDCRNAITQITEAIKDGIGDFIANGCNTYDFENDDFEDDLDAETSDELDDEADDDFDKE